VFGRAAIRLGIGPHSSYISGLLNISGTTLAVKLESSNVVHGYIKY